MKISNSKKQLAKIIHENGGWRDGAEFSAQDKDGEVFYYSSKPTIGAGREVWDWTGCIGEGEFMAKPLPNWHQTILSRDEYFHLYPAPGAVVVENKTTCHLYVTDKPTIEQLAADYHAKLAIAQQAQEEADSHRCGAEAALERLVAAGKALGLVLDVAVPEPELVITDLDGLIEGDVIELTAGKRYNKTECAMVHIDGVGLRAKSASDAKDMWWDLWGPLESKWRFLRRPAKEADNA